MSLLFRRTEPSHFEMDCPSNRTTKAPSLRGLLLSSKPSMTTWSLFTSTVGAAVTAEPSMIAMPLPSAERSTIGWPGAPSLGKVSVAAGVYVPA